MAWKATRPSSAQTWTHRSPSLFAGTSASEAKTGSGASCPGSWAPSPALAKTEAPKPKVTVSELGPASRATSVSWTPGGVRPSAIAAAAADQRFISEVSPGRAVPGVRSKAAAYILACIGCVMPPWCAP